MTIAFTRLREALTTASVGNVDLPILIHRLRQAHPLPLAGAATQLATLGGDGDATTVAELAFEIASLSPAPQSIACALAAAKLERSAEVLAALALIRERCAEAVGAPIPVAVLVDATLLRVCRDVGAHWDATRIGEPERAEELARRLVQVLGLGIYKEKPETNAARIAALDPARAEDAARAAAVEQKIRASLPPV